MKDADVTLQPEAIDTIIRWYARESGVRNLKKLLEKVRHRPLCFSPRMSTRTWELPYGLRQKNVRLADYSQIYRKAAYKIVLDLGEQKLPEPHAPDASSSETVNTVEVVDPDVKPVSERLPGDEVKAGKDQIPVTTEPRKGMKVPDSVKLVITADNLRDYVGA